MDFRFYKKVIFKSKTIMIKAVFNTIILTFLTSEKSNNYNIKHQRERQGNSGGS